MSSSGNFLERTERFGRRSRMKRTSKQRKPLDGAADTALSTDSESGSGDGALPIAAAPISQTGPSTDLNSPSSGEIADVNHEDATADPDRFFDLEYAPVLRRLIHRIVYREGPVTLRWLARRVAQEHGWQRTGKRIQAQVEKNLSLVERHSEFDTVFVWTLGSYSDSVPFRGLNGRPVREISRCRVEDWRASFRVRWLIRRFRSGPQSGSLGRVSSPRSSNRTCGFPASGFRTRSLSVRRSGGSPKDSSAFCSSRITNISPFAGCADVPSSTTPESKPSSAASTTPRYCNTKGMVADIWMSSADSLERTFGISGR